MIILNTRDSSRAVPVEKMHPMKRDLRFLFIALIPLSNACCTFAQCRVDWKDAHQTIDGFGACSAWTAENISNDMADLFFSTNDNNRYTAVNGATYTFNGAGLSLLRNRIRPGDDTPGGAGDATQMVTDEMATMKKAQDRGARVWSAPWTPPKALKDRNSFAGGHFVGTPTNYQAYANELANYVANMKSNGIDIFAISIQNEPEWDPTAHGQGPYDACLWSSSQFHDFVPYLYNALAAKNVSETRIMIPESANWGDPKGFAARTLTDPATAAAVSIIANHNYIGDNDNGDQNTPDTVNTYGKQLWETEISTEDAFNRTKDMDKAIYWAGRIHDFLTTPGVEVNAWHYWYLLPAGDANGGLTDSNRVPAKRLFVMGNFSRFIRPGYVRFGVTGDAGEALISAYQGPDGNFVIVAINPTGSAINETFKVPSFIGGKPDKSHPGKLEMVRFIPDSVTPWTTSGTNIAVNSLSRGTPISFTNASFTYSLQPMSVVTFAGQSVAVPFVPWWRWLIIRWWWWVILMAVTLILWKRYRRRPFPPPSPET